MLEVQEIRKKCEEVCGRVGVPFDIPIFINSRLRRSLGRCVSSYDYSVHEYLPQRLEFSKMLLENGSDEEIQSVIEHECCHYIVTVITGERHGHDNWFKKICRAVGCSCNGCSIELKKEDSVYKYNVVCKECGHSVGYHAAGNVVKRPEHYSCGNCGGELEVIINW